MALAFTLVTSGGSTVDGTSIATASHALTPAADRIFVAILAHGKGTAADAPTSYNMGSGTWTIQTGSAWGSGSLKRTTAFRSIDASGTEVGTFDFGANTQTGFIWFIVQIDGADISGTNGDAAFVQTCVDNNTTSVTTATATFAGGFGSATNGVLTVCGVADNSNATIEANYTPDGQDLFISPTPPLGANVAWRSDNDTDPTWTHASSQSGMRAWEIKAAGVSVVVPVFMNHYQLLRG